MNFTFFFFLFYETFSLLFDILRFAMKGPKAASSSGSEVNSECMCVCMLHGEKGGFFLLGGGAIYLRKTCFVEERNKWFIIYGKKKTGANVRQVEPNQNPMVSSTFSYSTKNAIS